MSISDVVLLLIVVDCAVLALALVAMWGRDDDRVS